MPILFAYYNLKSRYLDRTFKLTYNEQNKDRYRSVEQQDKLTNWSYWLIEVVTNWPMVVVFWSCEDWEK